MGADIAVIVLLYGFGAQQLLNLAVNDLLHKLGRVAAILPLRSMSSISDELHDKGQKFCPSLTQSIISQLNHVKST